MFSRPEIKQTLRDNDSSNCVMAFYCHEGQISHFNFLLKSNQRRVKLHVKMKKINKKIKNEKKNIQKPSENRSPRHKNRSAADIIYKSKPISSLQEIIKIWIYMSRQIWKTNLLDIICIAFIMFSSLQQYCDIHLSSQVNK